METGREVLMEKDLMEKDLMEKDLMEMAVKMGKEKAPF